MFFMTKIENYLMEMATVRPHIQTFGLPIFTGTGPAPKQKAPEKGSVVQWLIGHWSKGSIG